MHQVFTEIGIINQLSESFLRQILPKPLSIAQFHVLTHLTRLPGAHTPSEMTIAFQVTKGAMTHTLGLMSKNEFVEIKADPNDGRSKRVQITAKGEAIYTETITKLSPYFLELSSEFTPTEIKVLTNTLTKIRLIMDEKRNI